MLSHQLLETHPRGPLVAPIGTSLEITNQQTTSSAARDLHIAEVCCQAEYLQFSEAHPPVSH